MLMIVNLFSPDDSRDNLYLSNYATIQLRDELSRLPGVGDVSFLGQRDYSMRVWLDPEQLAVAQPDAPPTSSRAIEQQNVQVAAGQIGQPPVADGPGLSIHDEHARPADRRPSSSATSSLKTDADGRHRPPAATSPASNSARWPTTRSARSTASRRSPCRSTSCPAPTPWKPPSRSRRRWRS